LSSVSPNLLNQAQSANIENSAIVEAATAVVSAEAEIAPGTNDGIELYVRNRFTNHPVLAEIARCESQFRQYGKTGAALRGTVVPSDIGVMQVNEYFHGDAAKKLGFDLHTIDGNLNYAEWLYEHQGVQPWSASRFCWAK
jgi:hypothetical protein